MSKYGTSELFSEIRNFGITFFRRNSFQFFWERLYHISLLGMNYWASRIDLTGEMDAIRCARISGETLVIVDIGANQGQFALAAWRALKPCVIHSFEPSRFTFDCLVGKIKLAGAEKDIIPYNLGIGEKKGELTLFTSEPGATIASVYNLRNPHREFREEHSEQITIETLDNFVVDNSISRIDYLKIDVEGHELMVLKGAVRLINSNCIRFIQFEFGEHDIESRTYFRDFFDMLHDRYEIYRIVPGGLRLIKNYSSELEVFATINYLARLR